jgi:C-terminal processing protease CtpA/Prc
LNRVRLITHAGGIPGYSAYFLLAPDSRTGVYLASNAGGVHARLGYLAQLSLDLLGGKKIGTGLVREIVGLGLALATDEKSGLLRVTDIIPKSPASRARLSAGILIRQINGVSVKGKTLEECLGLMAGPAGTRVSLELMDGERPATVEVRRGKFFVQG